MSTRVFLISAGAVLVTLSILGSYGAIGPSAERSIFNDTWVFTTGENMFYLVWGAILLIAACVSQPSIWRGLTLIFGLVTLALMVVTFFSYQLANVTLEKPMDTLLFGVLTVWAFSALSEKENGRN